MASDISHRETSGGRTVLPLQTNWQAYRRGTSVFRSGDVWWEQIHSHNRQRRNSKLRERKTSGQSYGGIDAQLELEVKFGNITFVGVGMELVTYALPIQRLTPAKQLS